MTIQLVDILPVGGGVYRLVFQDGPNVVTFSCAQTPGTRGLEVDAGFLKHFRGRTSGREAFEALAQFIRGEAVSFPVNLRREGFMGAGR